MNNVHNPNHAAIAVAVLLLLFPLFSEASVPSGAERVYLYFVPLGESERVLLHTAYSFSVFKSSGGQAKYQELLNDKVGRVIMEMYAEHDGEVMLISKMEEDIENGKPVGVAKSYMCSLLLEEKFSDNPDNVVSRLWWKDGMIRHEVRAEEDGAAEAGYYVNGQKGFDLVGDKNVGSFHFRAWTPAGVQFLEGDYVENVPKDGRLADYWRAVAFRVMINPEKYSDPIAVGEYRDGQKSGAEFVELPLSNDEEKSWANLQEAMKASCEAVTRPDFPS